MENKIYNTRVLPLKKYVESEQNGKRRVDVKDNLSREELLSLPSEKARMLWTSGSDMYVAECPLSYKEGMSIKFSIVYLYDELSTEDKQKYYDRTIMLPLTKGPVIKVYDENSQSFFPKTIVKMIKRKLKK